MPLERAAKSSRTGRARHAGWISKGMEAAHSEAYSVFVFDESGHDSVYANYPAR